MLTENGELGYMPKDLKYKRICKGPFIDDVGIFREGRGGMRTELDLRKKCHTQGVAKRFVCSRRTVN